MKPPVHRLNLAAIALVLISLATAASANDCRLEQRAWEMDKNDDKRTTVLETCKAQAKAEQEAADAQAQATAAANRKRAALPGVRVGMTKTQVTDRTNWGKPETVNKTVTATGTTEQWVYGGGNYVYFKGDKVSAIQTNH